MAQLPLVPKRGMIGALAGLLLLMTLAGGTLLFSFAAHAWPRSWQIALVASVVVLSALFGATAVYGLKDIPRE